jgi:hypothetical protein
MSRLMAAAENSGRPGRGTEPRQETPEEQPGAGEGQVRLRSPARNQSPTRAPPEGRVGQPLSTLLGTPWELGEFLRVAAGIAKAVGGLHQRGVIHKHLQPSNILVDTITGEAWLTGLDPSRTTAEAFLYMARNRAAG